MGLSLEPAHELVELFGVHISTNDVADLMYQRREVGLLQGTDDSTTVFQEGDRGFLDFDTIFHTLLEEGATRENLVSNLIGELDRDHASVRF